MLQQILVPILAEYRKIGVFVSGGLDSALLIYLIYLLKSQDHIITIFTVPRPNKSIHFSQVVINWLDNKFGTTSQINIVGNSKVDHSLHVTTGILKAKECDLDIILLGDTKNPSELPKGPKRPKSKDPMIMQPFFDVTKDKIIAEILTLEIPELITITGTCGIGQIPPCEICWPCMEKNWALAKNNF